MPDVPTPPRLAVKLVERAILPSLPRQTVLGDLAERYVTRRARGTRLMADLWYWWESVRAATVYGTERGRSRFLRYGHRSRRLALRSLWDDLRADGRFTARDMAHRPGFSVVAVLTLALGVGVTTAVFSVVSAVVLRPLPYPDPDRLVVAWAGTSEYRGTRMTSEPDFLDYRRQRGEAFEDFAAIARYAEDHLTGDGGGPEPVEAAAVSRSFFPLLGTEMLLGRHFLPEEDRGGGPDAVIVSYGLWQRRFGGAADIIGRSIALSGRTHTVVGVLEPDFRLDIPTSFQVQPPFDLFVPLKAEPDRYPRSGQYLLVIGRLRAQVTFASARVAANRISELIQAEVAEHATDDYRLHLTPLHGDLVGDVRRPLLILMVAVASVLLITCANVANMLLARLTSRHREFALRTALGATRGRLLRQTVVESGILSALAGVSGLAIAAFGLALLGPLVPGDLPRAENIALDGSVVGFALLISMGTALLLGTLPALRTHRQAMHDTVRGAGRGGTGRRERGTHRLLVVGEVAATLVLLLSAGLMVRTFIALQDVDPGFVPAGALSFELNLPATRYPDDAAVTGFVTEFERAARAVPGTHAVGLTSTVPLSGQGIVIGYTPPGAEDETELAWADMRPVTPGLFDALGTRMIAGRAFDTRDHTASPAVAILDVSTARRLWPQESAVGKRLHLAQTVIKFRPFEMGSMWVEIVGVVDHVRNVDLGREVRGQIYRPHAQMPLEAMHAIVRARDPGAVVEGIRTAVSALDPALPLGEVRMMTDYVRQALAPARFMMWLMGLFGILAAFIAAVGIYGVVSYLVSRRTAEVGVRMALGAPRQRIVRLVIGQGMVPVLLGLGCGILTATAVVRILESQLFGVHPLDPTTFAGVTVLLVVVSAVACWIPARRASRVPPTEALRGE